MSEPKIVSLTDPEIDAALIALNSRLDVLFRQKPEVKNGVVIPLDMTVIDLLDNVIEKLANHER